MSATMLATDRLDRVLARLDGVQPRGDYYKAHCPGPSHRRGDRNRSLSITPMADGGIRLNCFADCAHADIVAAANIDRADLRGDGQSPGFQGNRGYFERHDNSNVIIKQPKPPKPPPPRRVKRIGQADYPVKDAAGVLIATKRRTDWLLEDGTDDKDCWWEPKLTSLGLDVEDVPLFGSEHLAAVPTGTTVVVVEGEKAAQALLDAGIAAVGTVTGAGVTPSPASLAVLAGYEPVLWPDNDDKGRPHMQRIASRLAELDIGCRWFDWRHAPPKGDAFDWLQANAGDGCGLPILRALLHNAPSWEAPVQISPNLADVGEVARLEARIADMQRQLDGAAALNRTILTILRDPSLRAEGITAILLAIEVAAAEPYNPEVHEHDIGKRHPDGWVRLYLGNPSAKERAEAKARKAAGLPPEPRAPKGLALRLGATPGTISTHIKRLEKRVNLTTKTDYAPNGEAAGDSQAVYVQWQDGSVVEMLAPLVTAAPTPRTKTAKACPGCGHTGAAIYTYSRVTCTGCGSVLGEREKTRHRAPDSPYTDLPRMVDPPGFQDPAAAPCTDLQCELNGSLERTLLSVESPPCTKDPCMVIEPASVANTKGLSYLGIEGNAPALADMGAIAPAPDTCALCPAPATHWTGHRPPLHICKTCLMTTPIPMGDDGQALIVGTATYSVEHRSAADD